MADDRSHDPPSFVVPAVLDDAGLTPYQFRALGHISRRAGGAGGLFYGGATGAAKTCRMSIRQWKYALADLERLGFIQVVEQSKGRRTTYRCTACTGAGGALVQEVHGPGHQVHTTGAPGARIRKGVPGRSTRKESPERSALRAAQAPATTVQDGDDGDGATTTTALATVPFPWPNNWTALLLDTWKEHAGDIDAGRLGKACIPMRGQRCFEDVQQGLVAFLRSGNGRFGPEVFVRSVANWINGDVPGKKLTMGEQAIDEARKFLDRSRGGSRLSVGERQMVEVGKVLGARPDYSAVIRDAPQIVDRFLAWRREHADQRPLAESLNDWRAGEGITFEQSAAASLLRLALQKDREAAS